MHRARYNGHAALPLAFRNSTASKRTNPSLSARAGGEQTVGACSQSSLFGFAPAEQNTANKPAKAIHFTHANALAQPLHGARVEATAAQRKMRCS
jgi:hypothetical protein